MMSLFPVTVRLDARIEATRELELRARRQPLLPAHDDDRVSQDRPL